MIVIENPTGLPVRNDTAGRGRYGAPRGGRRHDGVDFECLPGQVIKAPIAGDLVRWGPYRNDPAWSGARIAGERMQIKLFYFEPFDDVIGTWVRRGQAIGKAQNIAEKYPGQGMKPHVHLQIDSVDPFLIEEMDNTIDALKRTLKTVGVPFENFERGFV